MTLKKLPYFMVICTQGMYMVGHGNYHLYHFRFLIFRIPGDATLK